MGRGVVDVAGDGSPRSLTRKLIDRHLIDGEWGGELALRIAQTLLHDGTGPTILQELEVLGLDRIRTECSVAYVDHNLIQVDHKSSDDHAYLRTAGQRIGMWFSPAGNGISHPVHLERFARPGATLLGADSHTVGMGALGMLAIGAGGLDVALAMAGEPYQIRTPEIWAVELVGTLPDWVSAKDVILELLRRHGVTGGLGRIIEYHGSGLAGLDVWDRHVIANMGAELGATASVFPSDDAVADFLHWQGRSGDFERLTADPGAQYDHRERIDLSALGPLVALPHSPGNVVSVEDVAGHEIGQAYLGSSANPGYRDFSVVASIVAGRRAAAGVSFDVNPSTRRILAHLSREGQLLDLIQSGARIHQAGCNGCVGIGQAPATGVSSLRTTTRNFKGRTGTLDDRVYLASPETIAASALTGRITDPRTLDLEPPRYVQPPSFEADVYVFDPPPPPGTSVEVVRGPNITRLPRFTPLPDMLEVPVLLRLKDDISTDEIMPAQQDQLPWRSNIDKFSDFVFDRLDPTYSARARAATGGHAIVARSNYGQGSAREHAALSPRYLGLRVVLAVSFARIHLRNLANFGVLPLELVEPHDYNDIQNGNLLRIDDIRTALTAGKEITVVNLTTGRDYPARHPLTARQVELVLGGGVLEVVRLDGK